MYYIRGKNKNKDSNQLLDSNNWVYVFAGDSFYWNP